MLFHIALIFSVLAAVSASFGKICEKVPVGTNFPVAIDCTKFVTCNNRVSTINNCRPRQMFSPTLGICVDTLFPGCIAMKKYCPALPPLVEISTPPWRRMDLYILKLIAEIYGELNIATIDEQNMMGFIADREFACPQESGYFAVENEKSSYRICVGGKAYLGKCEDDGVFHSESHICVGGGEAVNKLASLPTDFETNCIEADLSGAYGYSNNCKLFQVCCGPAPSMHKCPLGMGFDTVGNVCSFKPTCKTA